MIAVIRVVYQVCIALLLHDRYTAAGGAMTNYTKTPEPVQYLVKAQRGLDATERNALLQKHV